MIKRLWRRIFGDPLTRLLTAGQDAGWLSVGVLGVDEDSNVTGLVVGTNAYTEYVMSAVSADTRDPDEVQKAIVLRDRLMKCDTTEDLRQLLSDFDVDHLAEKLPST